MRQLAATSSLCLAIVAAAGFAADAPAPAPAVTTVQELAWLAGCWSVEGGEPGSEEHWLAPAGGTLLGVSRTVRGGETVAHELMQIRERAPGDIVFVAHPSGQAETTFRLVSTDPRALVFENPEHDFPQRVLYRLDGDRLLARIEGTEGGEAKGFDFPMRRRSCDGADEPASR